MGPSSEMNNRINTVVVEHIFYSFWGADSPFDKLKVRSLGNSLEVIYWGAIVETIEASHRITVTVSLQQVTDEPVASG